MDQFHNKDSVENSYALRILVLSDINFRGDYKLTGQNQMMNLR